MKTDTFNVKINFDKDDPVVIQNALDSLSQYLQKFEEPLASKLVDKAKDKITGGQLPNSFVKAYKDRTEVLEDIRDDIHKISEDLIDEQDTSIKRKSKEIKPEKLSDTVSNLKEKVSGVVDTVTKPETWLDKIKDFIIGSIVTKLLGKFLGPLKKIGLKAIGALLAVGKAGWKLLVKSIKGILGAGLKAGGWIFKKIASTISSLASKAWRGLADTKLGKTIGSGVSKAKSAVKGVAKTAVAKGAQLTNKIKTTGSKAYGAVGKFFSSATSSLKNTTKSWFATGMKKAGNLVNGAVQGAKNLGSKAVSAVVAGAKAIVPEKIIKQFENLKNKMTSIGTKITAALKKQGGKAGLKVASKIPAALGKAASKLIPGIGWALVAYDVYTAFRKSNSATSFAVNLIDALSAGMLSLIGSGVLEGFDGENLGAYVDGLIQKAGGVELGAEDENILDGVDPDNLDQSTLEIIKQLENIEIGSSKGRKQIESSKLSDKHKSAVLQKYDQLTADVASGKKTKEQAQKEFKSFMTKFRQAGEVGGIDDFLMSEGITPLETSSDYASIKTKEVPSSLELETKTAEKLDTVATSVKISNAYNQNAVNDLRREMNKNTAGIAQVIGHQNPVVTVQ